MVAPVLTETEMDAIGADLGVLRPSVCTIQKPSDARDAAGAPVSGQYGTVAVVDCRVDAAGSAAVEKVAGPRFGADADFVVSVPRGTDVRGGYRVKVSEKVLEVVYAPEAASFSFELAVLCRASS